MASGGKIKGFIPELTSLNKFHADDIIKDISIIRLSKMNELIKDRKIKITILGASHSGFSVCWLLLNKFDEMIKNNIEINILHRDKIRVNFINKEEASRVKYFITK